MGAAPAKAEEETPLEVEDTRPMDHTVIRAALDEFSRADTMPLDQVFRIVCHDLAQIGCNQRVLYVGHLRLEDRFSLRAAFMRVGVWCPTSWKTDASWVLTRRH